MLPQSRQNDKSADHTFLNVKPENDSAWLTHELCYGLTQLIQIETKGGAQCPLTN
jgi:hypothetical protein